jgi:tetratricopeptide (TPR) repeat protein
MAQTVHYCSQCGAKLVADANFCVECGVKVPGARARRPGSFSLGRYAPLVVIGVVLVVAGTAVSIGFFNPKTAPSVAPQQGGAPATGQMPAGHPPISIPDDVKQTIRDMQKSAEAQPENLKLWKQLAEVQYRAGQVQASYLADAEISYQHVLQSEPTNTEVLRALGNIAFDREQPEKAIDLYNRYLAIKPGDQNVQTDLNTMRLAAGQTDQAIAGYQKTLAADPKFFQAQFNLGLAYHTAGKTDDAITALKKARELAPDDRSRKQVDQVMARMQGGGGETVASAPAAGGSTAPADTLRAGIESFFRHHPIMGPKIDRFDWTNDNTVRVLLNEFPMSAMPEFVRKQLTDHIRDQIKEQKAAHKVTKTVQVQLVDGSSGQTMETVSD